MMRRFLFGLAAATLAAPGFTQTRTVAATGADHTTINDALAFFNPDPDGLTDNIIQITDTGLYDEAISITVPVTIEGTGASRPVIAAQLGPSQIDADDGITVQLAAAGTVTLRNLIVIPSSTTTPADDLLRAFSTDLTLNLEDLVITANDGANNPVTLDGLTEVDLTSAIRIGDDCAFLSGASVYNMTNVVMSHAQNGGANDGLVCSATGGSYFINDGCVFSFNNRLGIQANGINNFVLNAPTTRVLVLGNKGFAGIWFAGAQDTARSINGCNVLNNVSATAGQGWGVENQSRGAINGTFQNMIIAGNGGRGFLVGEVGTGNTIISDVTIVDNGATTALDTSNLLTTGDVTITDSILAGSSASPGTAVVANAGTGAVTIDFSALVTSGPYSLAAAPTTGTVTVTNSINANPEFVDTTTWNVGSYTYQGAASAGADLDGGALFAPPPAAKEWLDY